ncbi:non-canonical purine NTP pyrophosphatase [Clostridia bacterium]|nr:non-canonical purine NTP pyrophosphatase [Clostridia bacterium]
MNIVIATNNQGKLREFKQILQPHGFTVMSMKEAGVFADTTEDGETFEENAHIKAEAVKRLLDEKGVSAAVIADDSGLEVEFLGGAPGIYSARYGGEGISDSDRCELILSELRGVDKSLRGAAFVCAIYLIDAAGEEHSVKGSISGFIGTEAVGVNGFGYDPIFMVEDDGVEVSFAEIQASAKNKISHRADALRKLGQLVTGN